MRMSIQLAIAFLAFTATGVCASASAPTSDTTGKVFFVEPVTSAQIPVKFHVKMGVEGRKICAAGKETADKTCGHHHIVIDGKSIAAGQVIPTDDRHLHFGKGQTEADVTLTPGKHTLTLQFADFAHRSYGDALSQTIEVTVK